LEEQAEDSVDECCSQKLAVYRIHTLEKWSE